MPIFTMEIDKREVVAFSGNYSVKADWDQVPFFNMLGLVGTSAPAP